MEFNEQQQDMIERFVNYLHTDEGIDIIPAVNKKTKKVEMHIVAREETEDEEDQYYLVPLGILHGPEDNPFKKYDFDVDMVDNDVIYERKPWWKFWERS